MTGRCLPALTSLSPYEVARDSGQLRTALLWHRSVFLADYPARGAICGANHGLAEWGQMSKAELDASVVARRGQMRRHAASS